MIAETGYNPTLVALSIVIAVFASYTALDVGGHVRSKPARTRWLWVAGAALAMGGGIWSMHFVGMLAFEAGMPVAYAIGLTVTSFLIAVLATGFAFAWVSRDRARARDVLVSGPAMGVGVAAMHYTGMAAMRMHGSLAYSLPVVTLSVLIAVLASTVALWLTFRRNVVWQKLVASGVMGLAVAGMHYTGMAAATFSLSPHNPEALTAAELGLGQQNLALYVAGATFLILFLGMLASSVDGQRVQRSLFASEERFRAAAEAVGDIIWTTDRAGRMMAPQPDWSKFTGQSVAEYSGDAWTAAIHPDDVASTLKTWRSAVTNGREYIFEHRVRRSDGAYRNCSVRAVPVRDADSSVREWVGVHEDITERREFEAALTTARDAAEAANVAKSTFLANMSHELRTPLSAIIGYSEMLLEEAQDGADSGVLADDIRKIESNARHLLGLINDVLDLSKVESGKMDVYAESFDIEEMLADLATTIGSLIAKKSNRFELNGAAGLGSMQTDLTKVRQILLNLLSNAAKFTEGGTIALSVSREEFGGDEVIRFRVTDTGIGMSKEQLGRLFQRFEQADESTTRKFGGTGLGLSLTKAFVDMLGGSVSVASVPGSGTTFEVRLPATYAAGEQEHVADVGQVGEGSQSNDLVLVIDDDADQRALMTKFLHREGFKVRTAADGAKGLTLAQHLKPHAILLDVMMPGIDGWSVLSALKADPGLTDIPVIMVTFVEQRALAASLGAADYVMKPVRWDKFKGVMDRYRPAENDVLIIDDDADTRTRVCKVLQRDGWAVREAENGRDGLERLDELKPGIVLLDLTMPVMDGFAFLDAMRARPDCTDVPVVVLTAMDLTSEERRRLRGASQILNKGDASLQTLAERLRMLGGEAGEGPRHTEAA